MFQSGLSSLVILASINLAFGSDIEPLKAQIFTGETKLIRKYIDGIQTKARYVTYEMPGEKLNSPFVSQLEAKSGLGSTNFHRSNSNGREHVLMLPDNGYGIEEEKSGKYKMMRQTRSRGDEKSFPHQGINPQAPQSFPLRFYDFSFDGLMGEVLRNADPNVKSGVAKVQFLGMGQENWYGQEATFLSCQFMSGKPSKVYLDPNNDYAYLGFDSGAYSGRLEYGSTPGFDYPIPKRFDFWRYGAKKEKIRMYSVEIDEFKRVEVTPDDFDIEKQYGLKPLPPNRIIAAQTNRWAKWFYISGAVFAVISVLLIVIIRRRRTQALA